MSTTLTRSSFLTSSSRRWLASCSRIPHWTTSRSSLLPEGSTYTDRDAGEVHDRKWIKTRGLEYRLSRIAAALTGRPNIRTYDTSLWDEVTTLKSLRDDVVHREWETGYSLPADDTIYGRLLRDADVRRHGEIAAAVMDHYRAVFKVTLLGASSIRHLIARFTNGCALVDVW